MGLADTFPTVDAFIRWGHRQHEAGQMSAEELVGEAIKRYGASPALLESFVREAFYFFAIEAVTGKRLKFTDDEVDQPAVVRTSVPAEKVETLRANARRRAEVMRAAAAAADSDNPVAKFFEKHPTHQVNVPLLMMTREELLDVANQRESEAIGARRRAELCRRIAEKLQPGQVAEEVFTEGEVERIAKSIQTNIRKGAREDAPSHTWEGNTHARVYRS